MLRIRIIAGLISIVGTVVTLLVLPRLYFMYMHWMGGLEQEQLVWANWLQVALGVAIAVLGFWRFKKRKISKVVEK